VFLGFVLASLCSGRLLRRALYSSFLQASPPRTRAPFLALVGTAF
jgi:hypothetical protein